MTIAIHCHMDLSFLLGSWVVAGAPTRSTPDKFHGRLGRLVPETTPVVPMASIVSFVPSPEARCSTTVLVLWSKLDSWHGGSMVQSAVFIHNRLRVLCNSLCFCWTKILVMFGLRSWALGIQILLASSIHKPTLTTVESQPPKRYRKKYFFTTELENLPTSTVLGLPNTSFYAIDWGFPASSQVVISSLPRHAAAAPPADPAPGSSTAPRGALPMVAAAGAVLAKQKRRATDTWMIWGSGFVSEPIISDYYHMTRGINIYEPSNFRVAIAI